MLVKDKDLTAHNTFGIQVKAKWLAEYDSEESLRDILQQVRTEHGNCSEAPLRILHIGLGSNLLFLHDYEGLVLHNTMRDLQVVEEAEDHVKVCVGAGMVWDDFVETAIARGWFGVENLTAIPGEVGAAAVQNIGAYGAEVKDVVKEVYCIDLQSLEPRTFTCDEMQYAYRYSLMKSDAYRGRFAVTRVMFQLHKRFVPRLEYGALASQAKALGEELTAMKLRNVIREMRDTKLPDPKVWGNAGSFFMNPVVDRSVCEALQQQYAHMPYYDIDSCHVKIPAGWLIEQAGWKGRNLGPAGVYERQALVLVNRGGATGADIVRLCETIQKDVQDKFGIAIQPEVNFIV